MDKESAAHSGSTSSLPVTLGVVGGVLLAGCVIILIIWYKRREKKKRTLKWNQLGMESPPRKISKNKKLKLQRQKTIEFELPKAPRFITTTPQVSCDRYDSTGHTPAGHFLTPTVSLERRASSMSNSSVDSCGSAGSTAPRERVRRQPAVQQDTTSDNENGAKLGSAESIGSDHKKRQYFRRGSHNRSSSVSMEELEISMYTSGTTDDELSGVSCIHSQGRLLFSIFHDVKNSCLIVNVHKAIALKAKRLGNKKPNTFVDVRLWPVTDRKQNFTTAICKDTADPNYEESFCFILEEGRYTHQEVFVKFVFQMRDNTASRQKETNIGVALFDLKFLERLHRGGTILDVWRDILPDGIVPMERGELQVSLCYEESEHRLRTKVVFVRDMKLPTHLQNISEIDFSDLSTVSTYIKVLLISNDLVLKRRRSSLQKCSADGLNTFSFNEEYIFPITAPHTVDDVTITFSVTCRDAQGHSLTLGKANVGSLTYAEGSGLLQWQQILESPSEWVTKSLSIT